MAAGDLWKVVPAAMGKKPTVSAVGENKKAVGSRLPYCRQGLFPLWASVSLFVNRQWGGKLDA